MGVDTVLDMEGGGAHVRNLLGDMEGNIRKTGGDMGVFILVMDMEVDTVKDMAKEK